MMVATYALLFLFDLVLLVLLLLVFAEKRRVRKDIAKMLAAESNVVELMKSMEQLIDEYKRVASRIEEDTCEKRDQLMKTIDRADRLLMELVRRSDRFEVAINSSAAAGPLPRRTEVKGDAARASSVDPTPPVGASEPSASGHGDRTRSDATDESVQIVSGPKRGVELASLTKLRKRNADGDVGEKANQTQPETGKAPVPNASIRPSFEIRDDRKNSPGQRSARQPAEQRVHLNAPGSTDDEEMLKTKKLVMDLSQQGLDVDTIARSLRIPVGQVRLILDVIKSKQPPKR